MDIIDFGIGDPDLPTPPAIVEEVKRQLDDPANHRYPSSSGEPEVRRAVAEWYKKRFNVSWTRTGRWRYSSAARKALRTSAGRSSTPERRCSVPTRVTRCTLRAGPCCATPSQSRCRCRPEKDFLPDLDSLPSDARMLYLNYPNNPTGAVATKEFLWRATTWCTETDTIFCYDNAYSEMTFDDYVAPSALEMLPGQAD